MPKVDPTHNITRRSFLLGSLQTLFLAGLGFQLYRLQVKQRTRYELLAENNRLAVRLLNAPRGRMLDRHGIPVAFNKNSFRLIVLAGSRCDLVNSLDNLSHLIDLSHLDLKTLLKEFQKHPHHLVPLVLKEPLSWDEVSLLEVHRPDLTGVAVEAGQSRFYPLGTKGVHFLGYVGVPAKEDKDTNPAFSVPGLRVGKSGIEKSIDSTLKGKEGSVSLEVNAYRHVTRELETHPVTPGHDVFLPLDSRLQNYVADRLSSYESASAVVLDSMGGICALVSHPAFDPHLFINGISTKIWKELHDNPYKPLLNKALNGLYAPGSTIKMAIALAALEKKIIEPSTTIRCNGVIALNNHPFHCWMHKRGGHGYVNCYQAISRSCDVFFYEIARRTGIENLLPVLETLGLGQRWLPEFRESVSGLLPNPAWKKKNRKGVWTTTDTVLTGIGQGYLLTTPLQLAVMTGRLATGHMITPYYLKPTSPATSAPLPFVPAHLDLIRQSMAGVTGDPMGTGFRHRILESGLEMGGKTGTSQVRRITLAERAKGLIKMDHRPWEEREHAVFCGYAPVQNPRYIVGLVVEHGGGGGSVATPIARDILKFAQQL